MVSIVQLCPLYNNLTGGLIALRLNPLKNIMRDFLCFCFFFRLETCRQVRKQGKHWRFQGECEKNLSNQKNISTTSSDKVSSTKRNAKDMAKVLEDNVEKKSIFCSIRNLQISQVFSQSSF